ncbi:MAG: hypothetical protein KKD44_12080 [Proteobacteria bacterium]|nr:hypothetical protein [Pseudomonadota bacterium]
MHIKRYLFIIYRVISGLGNQQIDSIQDISFEVKTRLSIPSKGTSFFITTEGKKIQEKSPEFHQFFPHSP